MNVNSTNSTKNPQKRTLRLSLDQVEKAIEVSNGNLHAACRLFKYSDGTQVGWTSFYHYVRKFKLHLQLDKYREKVAYQALEVVSMASKDNWKAALAILDRYGKYIGIKKDISSSQQHTEEEETENIEGYQDHKRQNDPHYITRLDNENIEVPRSAESNCPTCVGNRQNEESRVGEISRRGNPSGAQDHLGTGPIEFCA